MVTFVELCYHEITAPQSLRFQSSYILSIILTNLFVVELARAYMLLAKKKPLVKISSDGFDYEQRLLHQA